MNAENYNVYKNTKPIIKKGGHMKHKNLRKIRKRKLKWCRTLLPVLFIFSISVVTAQEVLPVSGGNALGDNGSLSYSVGQVIFTAVHGTSVTISQGVQQPFQISAVTGTEKVAGIDLSVTAYPNPATDFLILKIDGGVVAGFPLPEYMLLDINGRILRREKITGSQTQIEMTGFEPAIYFMKVMQSNNEIKTFKIIKN
jgi:hypothetical protein